MEGKWENLLECNCNDSRGGLGGGIEYPSFDGEGSGVDQQGVSAKRLYGGDLPVRRYRDFKLNCSLQIHAPGDIRQAGFNVAVNVAGVEFEAVPGQQGRGNAANADQEGEMGEFSLHGALVPFAVCRIGALGESYGSG